MQKKSSSQAVRPAKVDRLSATLNLDSPVGAVEQISEQRSRHLAQQGIFKVRDLLNVFPRRYLDMSKLVTIRDSVIGEQCSIVGFIYELKLKQPRRRLSLIEITVIDDTGTLIVTCFNQPWLKNKLTKGMRLCVSGTLEFSYGFKRMVNPFLEILEQADEARGRIIAFHPSTKSLTQQIMRRIVHNALKLTEGLYDPLPLALRIKHNLCSRAEAYRLIHEPQNMEDVSIAHRRFVYEELLFIELRLMQAEEKRQSAHPATSQQLNITLLEKIYELLPFKLSGEQEQAVADILNDMASSRSMNRLLLGDVGTGKTIVSLFALVACASSGHQAVMMGPTEILVRQYAQALGDYLDALGISWAILCASTSSEERNRIDVGLKDGSLSILFGTHALLENHVHLRDCKLVCIDEQQRFGVAQRQALLDKAPGADILSMTATPIPRSLALTLYGNMSLSYITQSPLQNTQRTTQVINFSDEGIAYDAVRAALERGEQAYVICPLIGISFSNLKDQENDEDEELSYAIVELGLEQDDLSSVIAGTEGSHAAAATQHAEILQNQIFPEARVGLLHGKMSSEEKALVMESFRQGQIDILVSTTIVEVGVDVPNATVMIVEDADHFGLAQLHQLRGRVGRGDKPGEIFLVTRSKAPQARERLDAMEQTEDGLRLSEIDLAQRREGDIFGGRQHGVSPLRLINVIRDKALIEAAFRDAHEIIFDNSLSDAEHTMLLREVSLSFDGYNPKD